MRAPNGTELEVLAFVAGGARCGVESSRVKRLLRAASVDALPGAPAPVLGVLALGPEPLAVYDFSLRFGRPPEPLGPDEHFILVDAGPRRVLIRSERALELRRFSRESVSGPERISPRVERLRGAVRLDDGLLFLYDPEAFLDAAESDALEAALRRRASPRPGGGGDAR